MRLLSPLFLASWGVSLPRLTPLLWIRLLLLLLLKQRTGVIQGVRGR